MKKTKYILLIFTSCFLVIIFLSSFVSAQVPPGKGSFCEMISERVSSGENFDSDMSIEERIKQRSQKDKERNDVRGGQDESRAELYAYLGSVSKTEQQKTAIEEFKSGSKKSVAAYREKQDLIISEFRNSANAFYEGEENSTGALLKEAKTACDSGKYAEEDIEEEFADRSRGSYSVGGKLKGKGEILSGEMQILSRQKKQAMNVAKELFGAEMRDLKKKLSEAFK